MSFLSEIKGATEKRVTVALLTMSATVAVGTLTLYQFHLGFLTTLDWFHFTLLAGSLPLPSLVANSFAMSYITFGRDQMNERTTEQTDSLAFRTYCLACLYSIVTFALGIFLSYCFQWRFRTFGVFMATAQVAIALYAYFSYRRYVRAQKAAEPTARVEP